ncbi:hypothetical protein [Microbulbifer sp. RZ01]|uniref:hypothetical protein n=1 Tax=Microbulbifer sp. RZ01 TaxID=3021711 RepID=UPI0027E5360B|nr:hypothetical protein [Microbulbifer sp. RZ01]
MRNQREIQRKTNCFLDFSELDLEQFPAAILINSSSFGVINKRHEDETDMVIPPKGGMEENT